MELTITAYLKNSTGQRYLEFQLPTISSPLMHPAIPLVDPRWARPVEFRDFSNYVYDDVNNVKTDFGKLVSYVNRSSHPIQMMRYKEGLLQLVDEHISRCGRILFPDLLLYVDCLAYLCYGSDLKTESEIVQQYPSWIKYIVDIRKNNLYSSTRWGIGSFSGSQNERDYQRCLSNL